MSAPQDFTSMMDVQSTKFVPPSYVPNTHMTQQASVATDNTGQTRVSSQELNSAVLCKLGQETVQDIITRTNDIFQGLRNLQPPNGSISGSALSVEKKARIQEQLRNVSLLFRRLRIVYDKCCELTRNLDMGYTLPESMIPMKEDLEGKSEERKQTEGYRMAVAERAALMEEVRRVNQEIKCAVDLERAVIYRINTMCAMVKS